MSEKLMVIAMPEHLGDIVACEPLFRRLHELHPECRVHFYTKERYVSLLRSVPYIDQVIALEDYMEFDCIKAQLPPDTLCFELNIPRRHDSEAQKAQSLDFIPLLHSFSRSLNVDVPDEAPRFYVDESASCPELPKRYLVFHCHTGNSRRQWRRRYWNMLAGKAFSKGIHVVEIGEYRTIYVKSHHYINLTGTIDLQTAAKVIRGCSGFVGIDSGFAHFANALGRFGLIIMGKMNGFPEYQPYSGDFGHGGNRSNLLRFYDVPADQLPFSVVSAVFDRFLNGTQFSFEECRTFCLIGQIKRMRSSLLFRAGQIIAGPFKKLKRMIRHHRRHHLKKESM